MRNLPDHRCPICGRRTFLTESVGGRRYSCPRRHPHTMGKAVPKIKLRLGKKVTWRSRALLWLKRKVRRA